MLDLAHERMNDFFEKWHVTGLPFQGSLHRFSAADIGDEAHCHPWSFTSHVLSGGYVEEVFTIDGDTWTSETLERLPGTTHHVPATHVHRITRLLGPECWTLVTAGPVERETRFYRMRDGQVQSRAWHEGW